MGFEPTTLRDLVGCCYSFIFNIKYLVIKIIMIIIKRKVTYNSCINVIISIVLCR